MDECCKDVAQLLSAYHDGELEPNELDLVDKHLAECDDCRKELSRLSRTVEMVAELPQMKVDEVQYIKALRSRLDKQPTFFESLLAILEPGQMATAASIIGVLLLCFVYTNGVYWAPQGRAVVQEQQGTRVAPKVTFDREPVQPLLVAKGPVKPTKALNKTETIVTLKMNNKGSSLVAPTHSPMPNLLAAHRVAPQPSASPSPAADTKAAFQTLATAAMKYQKNSTGSQTKVVPVTVPGKKHTSNVNWDELDTGHQRRQLPKKSLIRTLAPKMATASMVKKLYGSVVHVIELKPGEFKTGENELPHTGQIVLEVNDLPAFFTAAAKEIAAHKDFTLTRVNFDPKDETDFYLRHSLDGDSAARFSALRDGLNGLAPVKGILSIQNDAEGMSERVVKVSVRPVTLGR